MAQAIASSFRGFRSPNYTQVPDELFDDLLAELSGAELKVLLYIIRRTFGFKRDADSISLSQMLHGIARRDGQPLDRGTGLSKPTLLQTLRGLIARKIIISERRRSEERGDEPTVYRLNVADTRPDNVEPGPVVKKFDQGEVKKSIPPVVKKSAPQETVLQETENSNIRRVIPEEKRRDAEIPTSARMSASPGRPVVLAEVLGRRGLKRPSDRETHQAVGSIIREFAQEFGDKAPPRSSTTRALNLMERSHLTLPAFISTLYEARSVTRDRASARSGTQARNKMSYFFAILTDLLGLRPDPPGAE
jgi:hypothetical protein